MSDTQVLNKPDEEKLAGHFTFGKLILFALPGIIASVFASIYGVVDGLFVSNIGGPIAFGAINLASPIFMIVASLGFMFGTGGTALVSKLLGENKKEEANKTFSLITYTLIIIGVLLSVLCGIFYSSLLDLLQCSEEMKPYCLAYGQVVIPFIPCFMLMFFFQTFSITAGKLKFGLIIMLCGGFTNIIGDAILVGAVAPNIGGDVGVNAVRGAAIATALGLIISGIVPLIYYFRKNTSLLRLGKTELSFKAIGIACSNGSSEFLSNVSSSIVNTIYNATLLFLIGDLGVSAYGAISYINTIFTAVFLGYSLGIGPIIGYNYGSKNKEELKNIHKKSSIMIMVSSVLMLGLGELLASPLAQLFSGGSEEVAILITEGMRIFAISFLFKGLNMYASSFFTALNNGLVSGILALLRTLVFSIGAVAIIPSAYYYAYGQEYAMYGVWASVNFAELFALITTIIFIKVNRKKYGY